MRILMISDVYFPRINGVSTSIQAYRESLLKLGHQITLITPAYKNVSTDNDETDIYRIPALTVPFDPEDRLMSKSKLYKTAKHLLEKSCYHIIHIQTPFVAHHVGIKLARQFNLPIVETYHTYFEEYLYNYIPFVSKQLLRNFVRRFTRKQCNNLDAVITPSTAMKDILHEYGVSKPVSIIPTGIKIECFSGGDGKRFREIYNISLDAPVLVHVGRICHEKNIDFLLKMHQLVVHQKPDAILIIAGEGPALNHLKHLAIKLQIGKSVKFIGYLDRKKELKNCYAAGDVFVFSSRTETQGLVLLEAMACGTPVVSIAEMGTKDILHNGGGHMIADEDVDDFSERVLLILSNYELKKRMSQEARQYASTWSMDSLTMQLVSFYESVTGKDIVNIPENITLIKSMR